MLNQHDCHELLDSMAQVGFVPTKVEAIVVELCHECDRATIHNVQLSAPPQPRNWGRWTQGPSRSSV